MIPIDNQPDLFSTLRPETDVDGLIHILRDAGRWMPATEILVALHRPTNDNARRWLRAIARGSVEILSGPSSPGYIYLGKATPEDMHHWTQARISQGKDMIHHAIAQRRRYHQLAG